MALINCPECNKEISDKVKACPFCGYPFESSTDTENSAQKVEISSVNLKPQDPLKIKKISLGLFGGLLLIVIAIVAITIVNKNKNMQNNNSYIDTLNEAMVTMLEGGSDSEKLCDLTANVWINSIQEKKDPETDKYTSMGGKGLLFNDFNTSLAALFSDDDTKAKIAKIEVSQDNAEALMKKLQSPPEGLENSYKSITDLYSVFRSLTDLAINPSGSYTSFTDSKESLVNSFLSIYHNLETQIPEKNSN